MDVFTDRERIASTAGIETARQMALTAAVSIEVRDDGREVRQQAAAAALQGLAEGLRDLTTEVAITCIRPAFADQHVAPEVIDGRCDGHVLG